MVHGMTTAPCLCIGLARSYALSNNKWGSIREMWNASVLDWDLHPRRTLRSLELQQWNELKASLTAPQTQSRPWYNYMETEFTNGLFTIASIKKAIYISDQRDLNNIDPTISLKISGNRASREGANFLFGSFSRNASII